MSTSIHTVAVHLPQSPYQVQILPGALGKMAEIIRQVMPQKRVAILADEAVLSIYQDTLNSGFSGSSITAHFFGFDAREQHKNSSTVERLYQQLFELNFERGDYLIAFGGGVAGDLVGFVAATFLRGIDFIQVPTTLLAMVDASVGGKVGYNTAYGKNLIGAFHQPRMVIIDPLVLKSLSPREFSSGLAECIKHAVIEDSDLFTWTANNLSKILSLDSEVISELIARNVSCKAQIVIADEREQGLRALLNFGHTFAHAIEAASGYGTWLHGEAVALGMVAATHSAVLAGLCRQSTEQQLVALLQQAGLPTEAKLPAIDSLIAAMQSDKKVKAGKLRLVLPRRIGQLEIVDTLGESELRAGWQRVTL